MELSLSPFQNPGSATNSSNASCRSKRRGMHVILTRRPSIYACCDFHSVQVRWRVCVCVSVLQPRTAPSADLTVFDSAINIPLDNVIIITSIITLLLPILSVFNHRTWVLLKAFRNRPDAVWISRCDAVLRFAIYSRISFCIT